MHRKLSMALFEFAEVVRSLKNGLIPEGSLREVAVQNRKLNRLDRMGRLVACRRNCINADSIIDAQNGEGECVVCTYHRWRAGLLYSETGSKTISAPAGSALPEKHQAALPGSATVPIS